MYHFTLFSCVFDKVLQYIEYDTVISLFFYGGISSFWSIGWDFADPPHRIVTCRRESDKVIHVNPIITRQSGQSGMINCLNAEDVRTVIPNPFKRDVPVRIMVYVVFLEPGINRFPFYLMEEFQSR